MLDSMTKAIKKGAITLVNSFAKKYPDIQQVL
jgi:hypothetical protein